MRHPFNLNFHLLTHLRSINYIQSYIVRTTTTLTLFPRFSQSHKITIMDMFVTPYPVTVASDNPHFSTTIVTILTKIIIQIIIDPIIEAQTKEIASTIPLE